MFFKVSFIDLRERGTLFDKAWVAIVFRRWERKSPVETDRSSPGMTTSASLSHSFSSLAPSSIS